MKKLCAYFLAVVIAVAMTPVFAFANTDTNVAAVTATGPAAIKATAKSKTSILVSWAKVSKVKGYVVYRDAGKGFKKIKTTKSTKYLNQKLKKGKVFKYKVKAYTIKNKKNVYSKATYVVSAVPKQATSKAKQNATSIKLGASSQTLQKGKSITVKATIVPSKNLVSKGLVWTSSNKTVATVSSKGVVTAKGKGNCTITARTHNGLTKSIKFKVISELPGADSIEKLTKESSDAMQYADQIANTLAYDDAYFDDTIGFRTAGSAAEHAASKYLANEFKNLGLSNVERVPTTVDKWQFNEAYMQVTYKDSDGNSQSIRVNDMVSYASDGTTATNSKDYTGLGIVDMGMGTEADYNAYYDESGETNMAGKIVLVGVDQWNETWIDGPYMEAYYQNAKAIVTYSVGGYGQYSDDAINIQDICAPNLGLPCTSISLDDANKIKGAINNGTEVKSMIYVDNEVGDENGVSYNVVGKIKGTSNSGQQIIIAGHYDKYFYGFEDDSLAIGLVMGIAKAMVDSGYKPECDIVFVAHGSEEWGESYTSTDWAIGSWEMITEANPQWRGKTLALLNFELPGVNDFNTQGVMRTSYEIGNVGQNLLESDLLDSIKGFYKDGILVRNDDEVTMTDGIAYQFNGVPVVMPRQKDRTVWTQNRYHTQYDNNNETDTKGDGVYSKALLEYDLNLYGALAMYIDSQPALELDFGSRCDELEEAIDGTDKYATEDQINDYKASLEELKAAAKTNLKKAEKINADYNAAFNKNDSAAMDKARTEGTALNEKSLKAFKYAQDEFIGLADYGDTEIYHKAVQNNIDLYEATIDALSDGSVTEDDIWIPCKINGYYEYYAYLYSDEVCAESHDITMNKYVEDNWGTDKLTPAIKDAWKTTKNMYATWNSGDKDAASYAGYVSEYETYSDSLKTILQDYLESETEGMKQLKSML